MIDVLKRIKFWEIISKEVLELGGKEEDLEKFLSSPGIVNTIARIVVSAAKEASDVFTLTIDYDRPIAEAIAAGAYRNVWVPEKIIKTKEQGKQTRTFKLVNFPDDSDKNIQAPAVLKRIRQMGLRPATFRELLAFGETYTEIQRKIHIVALSVVGKNKEGSKVVPQLGGDLEHIRNLDVTARLENYWCMRHHFLVTDK